ncbi:putative fatty acyl-CoA reductase CG5065 [Bacillus rossius redtenbacheri]|uniref:putative fatty acyl-CoA reductase CG5065 n=1 Tax=Bacillus rossius redtenbacheri TaxID=93214 RepID=UPI002FDDD81D
MTPRYETVDELLAGRAALVTGATGFLGKVLVEKLLRDSQVAVVYLLLRPKRGVEVAQRLELLLQSKLFDRVRAQQADVASRVVAVRGDVSQPGAGLSPEDRETLLRRVHVVFHCAANVRFDQRLKEAVNLNTVGTRRILELCEGIRQLEALVHVSTAYCHCDKPELQEVTYPADHDPHKVIDLVSWLPDHILEDISARLVDGQPNTYAYSKNLSEQLVTEWSSKIPTGIARPSIVTGVWKEPLPGWVENLNGPTGLMIGAGKGVIRSMHCNPDYCGDFMPVDVTANAIIALAWKVANTRPTTPLVVNVTLSGDNPVTFGTILDVGRKLLYEYPLEYPLWYPGGSLKTSRVAHNLCVFFFHFIPAYFIDALLMLMGQKPFMVRVQRRVQGGLQMLQYYTTKVFVFRNDNLHALSQSLAPRDRRTFYTDVSRLQWPDYMKLVLLGTRRFCLKEDPATLPRARTHMRRMYWLDKVTTVLIVLFLFWLLYPWAKMFLQTFDCSSGE